MYIRCLKCFHCGKKFSRERLLYRCSKCNGSLEIVYDYARLKQLSWPKLRKRPFNHWRYKEFYPHCSKIISLQEGGTALVQSKLDKNMLFKLESQNPTGSFKDRGSTIEISHAGDSGAKRIICASTGNMGASVSAYSARADLECEIVLPKSASGQKIRQIENLGARITKVNGDYTLAARTAYQKFKRHQGFLVGDYSFRGEGEKSVGFEIMDQLLASGHASKPLCIICPVGNGTLISSIWKGLGEFKKAGLIKRLPILVGVQAAGCNPVAKSFLTSKPIKAVIPRTIAGAIACGDPLDGEKAVKALRESGGIAVEVSDREILIARRQMATTEGIDAEPSGATPYAALPKIKVSRKAVKILIITGHGLKDLKHSLKS